MSSNPLNVALYGHRVQVFMRDDRSTTSGSSPFFIDRLQNFEPAESFATNSLFELGHKSKIGVTQAPPEFRITVGQNLTDNMKWEWLMSGKTIVPAGQQQYNLSDVIGTATYLRAYALILNNDDTVSGEQEFTGLTVSDITYKFQIGGTVGVDVTYVGTSGSFKTSGNVNSAKTSGFYTGLGGIQGKDASVYFTTGSSSTTDRIYRLQSFNVKVVFPTQFAKELGKRSVVGTMADAPDVSLDFDVLLSDTQPTGTFFAGSYDYTNTAPVFNAYIRVFDPTQAEYLNVVRLMKIENVQITSHTPLRAQVRGLATAKYTLTSVKETTSNTGGMIVSNQNNIV